MGLIGSLALPYDDDPTLRRSDEKSLASIA